MRQFNKYRGTKGFVVAAERGIRFRYMISPQAQARARILTFWQRHGDEAAKEAFGISRRTLFRWQKSLRQTQGRLEGLNPTTTAPQNRRRRVVPDEVITHIVSLRATHPRLGKDKLAPLLAKVGYVRHPSTIGRLIADLKRQGCLPKHTRLSLYARSGRLVERQIRPRQKLRRPRGYRVLEVDTVVRFIDGVKRYILTAVDTEQRTAFAAGYTNHGSHSAADFLTKCRQVLPDCPVAIQTDNGSEFALHFAAAVVNLGLTHFHTYPRSPQQNAHVERFNRTINEEFLSTHRALLRDDVAAFNQQLMDWLLWYNSERPHYALGQVSPFCYMMSALPAGECQRWWTDTKH